MHVFSRRNKSLRRTSTPLLTLVTFYNKMAAPIRHSVLSLYKSLLREGQKITDYNFRLYALRRTRDAFKQNKNVSDVAAIQALLQKAEENLGVLRRQATMSQLYGSTRVAVEHPSPGST